MRYNKDTKYILLGGIGVDSARVRRLDRERRAESIIRQHLLKIQKQQEAEKKRLNEAAVHDFAVVGHNYFSEHGVSEMFDNQMAVWSNSTYATPVPQLLMRFVRIVAGDARLNWEFMTGWFEQLMGVSSITLAHPKMSLEMYQEIFSQVHQEAIKNS